MSDDCRFKLTESENDFGYSLDLLDTHKRESYGVYTYPNHFTNKKHVSMSTLELMVDKLNELYEENQALKNGSEYHQRVLGKLDKFIEEFEFYYVESFKRFVESESKEDRLTYLCFGYVLNDLQYVRDELQGEDYE